MKRRGRPWTSEEKKALSIMYADHVSVPVIAQKLKRTQVAIRKMTNDLGLHRFSLNELQGLEYARQYCAEQKIQILSIGSNTRPASAYDLLVKRNGEKIAVNVKIGLVCAITPGNVDRLRELGIPVEFWYFPIYQEDNPCLLRLKEGV